MHNAILSVGRSIKIFAHGVARSPVEGPGIPPVRSRTATSLELIMTHDGRRLDSRQREHEIEAPLRGDAPERAEFSNKPIVPSALPLPMNVKQTPAI